MVMTAQMQKIIADAQPMGWILEPQAKKLLADSGLGIPEGIVTDSFDTAQKFLAAGAGPVVIKAVSADIVHKTEHQAVVTGIRDPDTLAEHMERLLDRKSVV